MADLWQSLAFFLGGLVVSGVAMILRGDFLGRQAAKEVERRLSEELDQTEKRLTSRMDREIASVSRELREIKEAIVRLAKGRT